MTPPYVLEDEFGPIFVSGDFDEAYSVGQELLVEGRGATMRMVNEEEAAELEKKLKKRIYRI